MSVTPTDEALIVSLDFEGQFRVDRSLPFQLQLIYRQTYRR